MANYHDPKTQTTVEAPNSKVATAPKPAPKKKKPATKTKDSE